MVNTNSCQSAGCFVPSKMSFATYFCYAFIKNVLNLKKKGILLRKFYPIVLFLVFITSVIIFYIKISSFDSVTIVKEESRNSSSYITKKGSIDELNRYSIFFIERGGLTPRKACSIEAAARAHPRQTIYVMFIFSITEKMLKNKISKTLQSLGNVKFLTIYFKEYARNTPLERLIASISFYKSKWWLEHSTDVVKYLTLYKYGGICLDTDTLVVKSLLPLGYNWVGRQDEESINGAAISISPDSFGQKMSNALITELQVMHRYNHFGYESKDALTRVLQKKCGNRNVTDWSSEYCQGFKVYDAAYFYPVHSTNVHLYFISTAIPMKQDHVYAHYFWKQLTYKTKIDRGSPYRKLAEKYCPTIFQMFVEDFGT